MTTTIDLQAMIKKVSALLATADSLQESNPEAAANYRAKAEEMQRKYRIAEEELLATDATVAASLAPEWTEVVVTSISSPFRRTYQYLWWWAAEHAGIEERTVRVGSEWISYACGYAGDLRMAEVLFNAARLVFQERMEPKVKPELGDQVNAYRLREAGIERNRIAQILWGASLGSDGQVAHRKVAKLYKAECEARGVDPKIQGRGTNVADYRKAYAESFQSEFWWQLNKARNAADKTGGALQLPGRAERVKEAFWTKYPELRPSKEVAVREEPKECERCKKAKSGHCRDHRPMSQAEHDRLNRFRRSASGRAGAAAGTAAAREVEVGGTPNAQRLPEGDGTKLMREIKNW